MKRLFNSVLISKPMKSNLIITIILDVFALLSFVIIGLKAQKGEGDAGLILHLLIYIASFIILILLNAKEDWKTRLPIREQINGRSNLNIAKMIANFIICYVHYIYTLVFFANLDFLNDFIRIGVIIVIVILLLSRIIYIAAKQSPFIVFLGALIVFLVFSLIGLEDAVLSWTFVTIILSTLFIQFTNIDVKYLLSKDYRDKIINDEEAEEDIKEKLFRKKYAVLLYIPFLYITLLISEGIVKSINFLHFVNLIAQVHYEHPPTDFFSYFKIYEVFLKIIVFLSIWLLYYQFKDIVLDLLAKALIKKTEGSDHLLMDNGRYYRAQVSEFKFKGFKRKWRIDKNNYLSIDENYIIEYQINKETNCDSPLINIKCWSSVSKNANIKFITNDILQINYNYFVKDKSDVLNRLDGADKYYGKLLLRKTDFSGVYLFFIILILFIFGYFGTEYSMKNKYRGVYDLSESKKLTKDERTEFIVFSGKEIKVIKRRSIHYNADTVNKYTYCSDSLLIKDSNGNIVGGVDPATELILMYYDKSGQPTEYKIKKVK